jgi:hypothetical protein
VFGLPEWSSLNQLRHERRVFFKVIFSIGRSGWKVGFFFYSSQTVLAKVKVRVKGEKKD